MEKLFGIDWGAVFVPSVPVAEIVLRGTLVYLLLFVFMRFFLKREAGVIGIADLLVVVLIADAAQNAMTSDYKSVTDGAVLVLTIIFWNYALDWLAHRHPRFERLVRPAPLPLILDGRMLRRNMRREMITEEELMSQVRQQGAGDVAEVERAYMEGDGRISVVTRGREGRNSRGAKKLPG
jgi:uncharacterized membrane protein YcaP (DUF421 family)